MTSFTLKIIALVSMFLDHISYPIFGGYSFLNLLGRIAFPIFAFQISEGFIHTKSVKKYMLRLGLFALISQIPYQLFHYKYIDSSNISLNVFFTLLLGLVAIWIYDWLKKRFENSFKSKYHLEVILGIIIACFIGYIAKLIHTDYDFWGVIIVFMFYFFKENKLATIISFITLCIMKYGYRLIIYGFNTPTFLLGIFTILPIIFISLYKGKQGKKIKYFLYFFYPVHLLLLYLLF